MGEITKAKTPEEVELEKKLEQFTALETELAQRELEVATLQAELRAFEQKYLVTVGVRYAQLDEIRAQIAEAKARHEPENAAYQKQAAEARANANQSAETTKSASQSDKDKKFEPSDSLKKLYREIAKRIHPDLTTDEKERARRQKLMAEANKAYAEGDEARLKAILEEWESDPENVQGEGAGADLVRVIRKIAQIQKRLLDIESEISQLKESDIYTLLQKAEDAERQGRNLFQEMVERIEKEISVEQKRLNEILQKS